MSDTATGEVPVEPVPSAQREAAPAPPAEPEVESEDNRTARRRVLDFLEDTEGPQTVAEIIQGTGLIRNTAEQAIFRAVQAGQIERTAPGTYKLAAPKAPRLPSPESPPPSPAGHTDEEWIARIEAWQVNPASWNIEEDGPPPNDPNHRIPLDVVGRFKVRQAREAKAAAKQETADAALRDQLIAAAGGNVICGPGIDDVSPIRAAMEFVPLDSILTSIRDGLHRLMCPISEPATSWREPRLLKRIAQDYCQYVIVPAMVDDWGKASAKATETPVQKLKPLAGTSEPATPQATPATRAYVT
jgi:hypothetical protein